MSTHVMKYFDSPFAFLRAKACWVTGQYSDIRFTEGFGRGPLFQALLQHVLTLLRDPELPVGCTSSAFPHAFLFLIWFLR